MAADNADRERWGTLFAKLDANKDGKIEVSELAAALRDLQGVSASEATTEAEKIVSKGDKNESVALDVNEFMEYMQNHEQKLKLAFSDLDRNKDGKIEPVEVQAALEQLGVIIDLAEAEKLTKRLDKDNSLSVSWDEWRNFFQLHSSTELEQIVKYWRKSLMIDIGDSMTVPPDFTQKEKQTGMWWRHLVAGGLAGAVSRTSTAPLDRLKILLQVQSSGQSNVGIIGGLKQMVKEGGVKSLWRGNGTNVIKIAPESAIKFAAYEQLKKALKGPRGETSIIERFAAGSTAGAIAQTAIYPMEVIKTRLAVMKTGEYKGILDCGLKVSQREGLRALYKGYLPNMLGIIPYAGIDLTIYESLKQTYLHRHPETKNPGVLLLLACGTLSSTCGQLATYPLALIRTRLQAQVSTVDSKQGLVAMTRDIIAREGLWGLYRGIVPNFLKVLPAVSVSYVIYEQTKVKLGIK